VKNKLISGRLPHRERSYCEKIFSACESYSRRVLFAPGVVILPIELDLSDFFEFRFPFIKRGQGETPQSEQPAERSQKS